MVFIFCILSFFFGVIFIIGLSIYRQTTGPWWHKLLLIPIILLVEFVFFLLYSISYPFYLLKKQWRKKTK